MSYRNKFNSKIVKIKLFIRNCKASLTDINNGLNVWKDSLSLYRLDRLSVLKI